MRLRPSCQAGSLARPRTPPLRSLAGDAVAIAVEFSGVPGISCVERGHTCGSGGGTIRVVGARSAHQGRGGLLFGLPCGFFCCLLFGLSCGFRRRCSPGGFFCCPLLGSSCRLSCGLLILGLRGGLHRCLGFACRRGSIDETRRLLRGSPIIVDERPDSSEDEGHSEHAEDFAADRMGAHDSDLLHSHLTG